MKVTESISAAPIPRPSYPYIVKNTKTGALAIVFFQRQYPIYINGDYRGVDSTYTLTDSVWETINYPVTLENEFF